jgi:thiamine-phosphate pyrophosphorylase
MTRRQSMPGRWLIIDGEVGQTQWKMLSSLARGNGVILLEPVGRKRRRPLIHFANARGLTLVFERPRTAARVHNQIELTQALLRRTRLVLVSPIHSTPSHPDWKPLTRMRAATLARLAGRRAIALGGMNAKRFAKIAPLGFIGWAGISAFRT